MSPDVPRERAVARVNLAAIERNVARLRAATAPGRELCAVVKADGYGHGAAPVARAPRSPGGAAWLAVAAAAEAAELRAAGIDAPILVHGRADATRSSTSRSPRGADVVAWREDVRRGVDRARAAARARQARHRDGPARARATPPRRRASPTRSPAAPQRRARRRDDALRDRRRAAATTFIGRAARALRGVGRGRCASATPALVLHAANSAATLRDPATHFDMVRSGVAIYGLDPFGDDPADHGLEPALELRSYVAAVKPIAPGESAGYGRRFVARASRRRSRRSRSATATACGAR